MTALQSATSGCGSCSSLCALAAVAYWGWTSGDGVTGPLLALAAVGTVAVVWGLFLSPKASIEAGRPLRLALELAVWVAAGAALYAADQARLALSLVAVAVVSGSLNAYWK